MEVGEKMKTEVGGMKRIEVCRWRLTARISPGLTPRHSQDENGIPVTDAQPDETSLPICQALQDDGETKSVCGKSILEVRKCASAGARMTYALQTVLSRHLHPAPIRSSSPTAESNTSTESPEPIAIRLYEEMVAGRLCCGSSS
ncbi:hypothetical protein Dda_2370 [Drechslerella dactyloides]|uniref:Uncharacterized protein n=1 Tax=Drechslerella dactyloides TaxID=74499 RepID=A0AAD6NNU5_DREDA|nr:hypothetical protein Dda_2370 [Drechslerella dactyloides]